MSVFRRWPIWGKTWAQLGDNLGSTWGTNLGQLCLFSAGVLCQRCKKGPQAVSERVSNMVANPKWTGQKWLFLCYFFGPHLAPLLSASIGRALERVSKAWSAIPDGRAVVLGPPHLTQSREWPRGSEQLVSRSGAAAVQSCPPARRCRHQREGGTGC